MTEAGLPAIWIGRTFPRSGGLMSYGPSSILAYVGMAEYAARIIQGTAVADLPFQQPTSPELVINKRTAHALGLKIPEHLRLIATQIIE